MSDTPIILEPSDGHTEPNHPACHLRLVPSAKNHPPLPGIFSFLTERELQTLLADKSKHSPVTELVQEILHELDASPAAFPLSQEDMAVRAHNIIEVIQQLSYIELDVDCTKLIRAKTFDYTRELLPEIAGISDSNTPFDPDRNPYGWEFVDAAHKTMQELRGQVDLITRRVRYAEYVVSKSEDGNFSSNDDVGMVTHLDLKPSNPLGYSVEILKLMSHPDFRIVPNNHHEGIFERIRNIVGSRGTDPPRPEPPMGRSA